MNLSALGCRLDLSGGNIAPPFLLTRSRLARSLAPQTLVQDPSIPRCWAVSLCPTPLDTLLRTGVRWSILDRR